jgi:hypothetical protein
VSQSGIKGRVDTAEFRALVGKTSQLDPALKRALRKQLKRAAEPAAEDVRQVVLLPPESSGNGPSTGLRQGIAEGITVALMTGKKAGVAIRATTRALPEKQKTLVRAYGARKGWRHPTFGNTEQWRTQLGRPDYFGGTIYAHREQVTDAVEKAMAEALETLR